MRNIILIVYSVQATPLKDVLCTLYTIEGSLDKESDIVTISKKEKTLLNILKREKFTSPTILSEEEIPLEESDKILDLIANIANTKRQFIICNNSYPVLKKLYSIAQEHTMNIEIIIVDDDIVAHNLLDGMPNNPIIDKIIGLHKKEISL